MQVCQTFNSSRPEAVCGPISNQYQGSQGSEVEIYSKQKELEKIAISGQDIEFWKCYGDCHKRLPYGIKHLDS